MAIDQNEVKHVAMLARLELSEDEKQKMTSELREIIEYVDELEAAPTENVESLNQISGLKNITRQDEIKAGLSVADVLLNAPEKQDNFIKTKKVFE